MQKLYPVSFNHWFQISSYHSILQDSTVNIPRALGKNIRGCFLHDSFQTYCDERPAEQCGLVCIQHIYNLVSCKRRSQPECSRPVRMRGICRDSPGVVWRSNVRPVSADKSDKNRQRGKDGCLACSYRDAEDVSQFHCRFRCGRLCAELRHFILSACNRDDSPRFFRR